MAATPVHFRFDKIIANSPKNTVYKVERCASEESPYKLLSQDEGKNSIILSDPDKYPLGSIWAFKQISLPMKKEVSDQDFEECLQKLRTACQKLLKLDNPRIVRHLHYQFLPSNPDVTRGRVPSPPYCELFMQYCEGGNLTKHLKAMKRRLSYDELQDFARQLLEGLVYLRTAGIIHVDLKGNNVFVKMVDGLPQLKIGGLKNEMIKLVETLRTKNDIRKGAYVFISPEIVKFVVDNKLNQIGRETDIYGFGAVMIQCIQQGESPVLELTNGNRLSSSQTKLIIALHQLNEFYKNGGRIQIPPLERFGTTAQQDHLKKFLDIAFNQDERLEPDALLSHEFFN